MKKLLPLTLTALLLVACSKTPDTHAPIDTVPPSSTNAPSNVGTEAPSPSYTLKTYSLTDEYGNAGTYSEISKQYHSGDVIELEATVNAGYNFVGWFINDACVSNDLQFAFTMKANPVEIEARYNYYTVQTVSHTDDYEKAGTYTALDNKKISIGEQVTVEATVNDGYNFEGWYRDDVCVSEDLSYSFTMKAQNIELEARWNYYSVTVESWSDEQGTAGTYTKMADVKVSVGEPVTLTATVNEGFNFDGWYVNDNLVSTELEYSFTMKPQNVYAVPMYSFYTVFVDSWSDEQGTAGTYSKMQNQKISAGDTVTLTATVNDGFNFEGWYMNDVCVCEDLTYSFTMENKNIELEAKFSSYTVTAYSDSNLEGTIGTYTQINDKKVSAGDTITLIAEPAQGCNFEGWYIWTDWWNSICVCEDIEYTFEMSKEDLKIEARFSAYTLTTNAFLKTDNWNLDTIKPGINFDFFYSFSFSDYDSSMGDYTQYKNTYVAAGEEVTLTATEKSGYTFLGWKRGFDLVSTNHTYTFEMGKSDITYEAVYIINE